MYSNVLCPLRRQDSSSVKNVAAALGRAGEAESFVKPAESIRLLRLPDTFLPRR